MTDDLDFFAALEADIAAAVSKTRLRADRDKAAKLAGNTKISSAIRARAKAELSELNAMLEAAEWGVQAIVALFTEQSCDGCGSVHRVFLQYMERQAMLRKPTTQRYVRVSRPSNSPVEVLVKPHHTHICADCCHEHGFDLGEAAYLRGDSLVANLSPSYQQEDINA